MYIQKIVLGAILDSLRQKVDKDLISLLEKINPEVWVTRLTDDKKHLVRPFNARWWGEFAQSTRDYTLRIKEILAAKARRERPSLSRKIFLSKQELLEIAGILKIKIAKGANQWDVFGRILVHLIKGEGKQLAQIKMKRIVPSRRSEVLTEEPHPSDCSCKLCREKAGERYPEI